MRMSCWSEAVSVAVLPINGAAIPTASFTTTERFDFHNTSADSDCNRTINISDLNLQGNDPTELSPLDVLG